MRKANSAALLSVLYEGVVDVVTSPVVAADAGSGWLRDQDSVTPFQRNIFRSASAAGITPWLLLTTIVVAPIGEETLFRGFLFRGWHRSPRDVWAAIGATVLLWAIIHVQYDPSSLLRYSYSDWCSDGCAGRPALPSRPSCFTACWMEGPRWKPSDAACVTQRNESYPLRSSQARRSTAERGGE
jgi:membrane protease YdiL (CAAX protease family)